MGNSYSFTAAQRRAATPAILKAISLLRLLERWTLFALRQSAAGVAQW
jgi:hypothetical protein